MKKKFEYIIVGAGLCGLVLAKELSKKGKSVLLLEKGSFIDSLGTLRRILPSYDKFAFARSEQGIPIYRLFGVGGTSIASCGNAVMFTDEEYDRIGINFKEELNAAKKESCVKDNGLTIGKASARIRDVANKLGYNMGPMPKFSTTDTCTSCGNCYLGCKYGTKWTSRKCLKEIDADRVHLVTRFSVKRILESGGKAVGIEGSRIRLSKENKKLLGSQKRYKFYADKIILSTGGIGTPIILQNSGIAAGDNLFVDLFNVTYGKTEEFDQLNELTMSVVCDKFHKDEGFVLAPFIDNWFALYTGAKLSQLLKAFRMRGMMGIMTKIADESIGKVHKNGRIDKQPTGNDHKMLKKGSDIAKEILIKAGVNPKSIFVTIPRGAHPGGTAGIGRIVDKNLETQLKNLYVCDASVLPFAPGLPPMLSLIALTKWFSKNVLTKGESVEKETRLDLMQGQA